MITFFVAVREEEIKYNLTIQNEKLSPASGEGERVIAPEPW